MMSAACGFQPSEMIESSHCPRQIEIKATLKLKDVAPTEAMLELPTQRSYLERLNSDVVLGYILPYIRQKKMLATVATVSKHLKEILFSSEAEHIWNDKQSSFHLCIDTYCTSCLMKKLQRKGSHHGSIGFLRKFPISRIKLHCFVTDIPDCLLALSSRKYLESLDLTLTNKTNSPPLEDLLGMSSFFPQEDEKNQNHKSSTNLNHIGSSGTTVNDNSSNGFSSSINSKCIIADNNNLGNRNSNKFDDDSNIDIEGHSLLFPELRDLTLDSCHLQHVNLAGRARLLDILGGNLESLTFSGLSPTGVFSILSSRCPNLKKLRVDRASSLQDMCIYKNVLLEKLELHRSNFLLEPKCLDRFPILRSLRYTPSFRCDSAQMEGIIAASPTVLRELSIEIPSSTGNDILNAISRRLFILESLSIQGSYECGYFSQEAVLQIGRKCLFLNNLEVTSTKSVSDLKFDASSFMTLASYPSLKKLRLKYDDLLISHLSDLLNQSDSIREIIFWDRQKWVTQVRWEAMRFQIAEINKQFPSRIISLESII